MSLSALLSPGSVARERVAGITRSGELRGEKERQLLLIARYGRVSMALFLLIHIALVYGIYAKGIFRLQQHGTLFFVWYISPSRAKYTRQRVKIPAVRKADVRVMRYARMGGFAHSPEAYDGLLLPWSIQ